MIWSAINIRNSIIIDKFYSFFEVHYDEGFHFSGETHNFWECVYVQQGAICVTADERIYTLKSGDIIFHKPMELHKFYVDAKSGATLLIFSFSLDGDLAHTLENKVFSLSEYQQQLVYSMLDYIREKLNHYPLPENTPLVHRYLLPFQGIPTYSQLVTTYIYQLILSLIGDGNIADASSAPDALTFRKAVGYMNNQIYGQPSVPEIAVFCNVSVATLKRIFDKYAGISIHKYFLILKINLATKLLKNGLSVTETADKLGFSSQAYFSAVYKRETGSNPSDVEHNKIP